MEKTYQNNTKRRSEFKLPLAIITIIIMIFGSIGSGIAVAIFTYNLGKASLSGVTSPPENPSQKIFKTKKNKFNQKQFKLISEREILVKVYDFVYQQKEANKAKSSS